MRADKNMIRKKIIAENLERVHRKNPPILRDLEHMIERIAGGEIYTHTTTMHI